MPEGRLKRTRQNYLDHSPDGEERRMRAVVQRINSGYVIDAQWIRQQREQEFLCQLSPKPSND